MILVPAMRNVREQGRKAVCASNLRSTQIGLTSYAAEYDMALPPFAFSNPGDCNLPLSGHWGGDGQDKPSGPMPRKGVKNINLQAMLVGRLTDGKQLICPSAPAPLLEGAASLFEDTDQFSTYCLRFPYSEDVFANAPALAYHGDKRLLGVYMHSGGGQRVATGSGFSVTPQLRMDWRYRLKAPADLGDAEMDPSADAMLADLFWFQDRQEKAKGNKRAVVARWCHGSSFNVAFGGGAVREVKDDGTVRDNTLGAGKSPPGKTPYEADCAERVWQFFDRARGK